MKIGILTYQFGTNFGGQLQCYALYKIIQSFGHQVEVINYVPSIKKHSSTFEAIRYFIHHFNLNGFVTSLHIAIKSNLMQKEFAKFQSKYIHLGEYCSISNISEKCRHLDAIIVGSDQVWAPAHHNSRIYFIDFTPPFLGKKISYAPCCAINKVKAENRLQICNALKQFHAISARNIETQQFVKDLLNEEIPIVADPTLLCKFETFQSDKIPNHAYILTYILGQEITGGHIEVIKNIQKKYGKLPIYAISLTSNKPHYFNWATKTFWTLNPEDWVCFIKKATFLYTDSFHGVMFALKFHIPFLAYYKEESRASRFIDLKIRFGLEKQIISNVNEIKDKLSIQSEIDFNKTDLVIENLKQLSITFLLNAIND